MRIESEDILDKKSGIIIHQVNNKYVMGGGLALQIRNKYPQHYNDYMRANLEMGSIIISRIRDDLFIVGIVAQNGFGRDRRYTDYEVFERCVSKLGDLPYNIGCGDWEVIESILNRSLPKAIVVKL